MIRELILREAINLCTKDRQEDYGDAYENGCFVADLWGAYLNIEISPMNVYHLMQLLKIARAKTGKFKEDNFSDDAAYAALAGECAWRQQKENDQ